MLDKQTFTGALAEQIATTNNWDTVFALDFKAVNDGIRAQGRFPGTFDHSQSSGPDTARIIGNFSAWDLVGGSGHVLEMRMSISEFTFQMTGETDETRQDAWCTIQLDLHTDMGDEGSGLGGGTPVSFRTRRPADLLANAGSYGIVVTGFGWPGSDSETQLVSDCRILMASYFAVSSTLAEFDHTFVTVNLNSRLESKSSDYSWISPTDTSYGVIANGAQGGGTFAVLCMIEGNAPPDHHNVSPAIIGDKRAGFLLNKQVFLKHMIKPGIAAMFGRQLDDAQFFDDNFIIESDAIINKQELVLDAFTVQQSQNNPDAVTARIPKRSFSITLLDTRLVVNFNGLHHPYYKMISYLYEAHHYYTIQSQAEFDPETRQFGLAPYEAGDGEAIVSYQAALEKSGFGKAVDIALLVADIVAVAGTIFKGVQVVRGVEVVVDTAEGARVIFGSERLGAVVSSLQGFLARPMTGLVFSVAVGAGGITLGLIKDKWESDRERDPENIKPDMQQFAQSVMAPIVWPAGAGLSVEGVAFNGGFHITGTPDFTQE